MYINASRGQSPDHLIKLNKGNRFNNKKKWKITSFFIFCIQFICLVKFNKLPKFNAPEGQSQTISINQIKPKSSKSIEKTKKKTKLHTLTHQLVPTWVLQFCFFLFSRGFFCFWQKVAKTSRKQKKQKKNKIADPNSPACTYMGLAILFFLFSRGFCGFWPKVAKTSRKPQKKNADPNSPACTYMGLAILFFFCFLEVFLFFDQK